MTAKIMRTTALTSAASAGNSGPRPWRREPQAVEGSICASMVRNANEVPWTALVVGHDPVTALDQRQVRIAQVVAGQPGAAVEQKHDLFARSVAVAYDLVAVDGDEVVSGPAAVVPADVTWA